MPITFSCPCGKALRVADEHAGKRTKCPACQAVVTAPQPSPQFEVVEDEPQKLAPTPTAKPTAKPAAKPAAKHDDDDEDEGRGYSVAKKSADDEDDAPKPKKKPQFRKKSRDDDDDDDYEHDQPKKKGRSRSSRQSDPEAGKKILYIIGGILMLAIGGVVLYLGLDSDSGGRRPIRGIIFGICFIVGGLGTMVKGATGNFDDDE